MQGRQRVNQWKDTGQRVNQWKDTGQRNHTRTGHAQSLTVPNALRAEVTAQG